jgi:hypothetical protein
LGVAVLERDRATMAASRRIPKMFMLPRRRKAFARGLRFAAMMHQHHDMLFRASHVTLDF